MTVSRDIYAQKAIPQVARLLSLQDRNPFSPTHGCFHRDYWLYKTSDFPDAVRQFAVHALALVYKYEFPGSIYYGEEKIRDWTIAGLDYWAGLQHSDGSFDEFYPYERGWVGPSAFTMYTSAEAFRLMQDEMSADVKDRVLTAIHKAALFIAAGESEEDHLANHHAMACLAVWKAYELTEDSTLRRGFDKLFKGFLGYHNPREGWSREYDGVDPGYLSATVSFFAKIYQTNPDPEILKVIQKSVEFTSYFVYPNGFFAGSMGSRNTQHFYAHGFEVMAGEIPLAGAIAEKMLKGLGEDKLVPPEIMSDRYVHYRTPEFLLSYLDYTERPAQLPPLPYEREPFTQFFPESRIFVAVRPNEYVIANLAKGGVVKIFDRRDGGLIYNDCGLIGTLRDEKGAKTVTTQWVDPAYQVSADENGFEVRGQMNVVPSNKLFTPIKNIVFRGALVGLGWSSAFSHLLKGNIRKVLMLGRRPVPVQFTRRFDLDTLTVSDEVQLTGEAQFEALSVGGEFFVRYVPQSRFFQSQELYTRSHILDAEQIQALNASKHLHIGQTAQAAALQVVLNGTPGQANGTSSLQKGQREGLPMGVYDADYFEGRKKKPQLIYRLRRRTDEVEQALREFTNGPLKVVVDAGTADGMMLDNLQQRMGPLTLLGIELSMALLKAHKNVEPVYKTQADALKLPVKDGVADAIIATAIIEHVPDAPAMLRECARVLRPGGLLVMTTPEPTMERISSQLGILKDPGHQETFNLRQLTDMTNANGFQVVKAQKFMFSPVGFPAEKQIEKIFGPLGLSLVMANQLVVARRK